MVKLLSTFGAVLITAGRQPLVALILSGAGQVARANSTYGLQSPTTEIARQIVELHSLVLVICSVICAVLFTLLFYSIAKHRRSNGREPKKFTGYKPLEITWTIIPVLIVIGICIPATRAVFAMKDTSDPDITVKITGYQWQWRYDYLNENIGFYSALSTPREQIDNRSPKGAHYLLEVDHPLVVPVGKKIRILVTANDVIHSWWVPQFGVKQDAIPGFIRDAWFRVDLPGVYRGQCAELCGKENGFMPVVVEALPEKEYAAWVTDQRAAKQASTEVAAAAAAKVYTPEELKSGGEKVYQHTCVACHQANGQGLPPAFPALAHGQTATGPMAGTIDIVANGSKKNPAMAAWKNQLSDLELASVITYVRNSFGNTVGDMVQPKDIASFRSQGH
jgi:cytochrome c oxidase subunit II